MRRGALHLARMTAPLFTLGGSNIWVVPFAPEIVIKTMRHIIERLKSLGRSPYGGFVASFNPTYPDSSSNLHAWTSPWIFGLNEGPILMMIENYHTELVWNTIRRCPYIVKGLQRARFSRRLA